MHSSLGNKRQTPSQKKKTKLDYLCYSQNKNYDNTTIVLHSESTLWFSKHMLHDWILITTLWNKQAGKKQSVDEKKELRLKSYLLKYFRGKVKDEIT